MNKQALNRFKKIFQEEANELNSQEANINSPEDESSTGDEGDQASALSRQEFNRVMLSRIKDRRSKIATAFARIEAGSFGTCDECEEDIEIRRLQANPTATRCVECQESSERRSKSYVQRGEE